MGGSVPSPSPPEVDGSFPEIVDPARDVPAAATGPSDAELLAELVPRVCASVSLRSATARRRALLAPEVEGSGVGGAAGTGSTKRFRLLLGASFWSSSLALIAASLLARSASLDVTRACRK